MNNKYIELAKKLKALAERGIDGEKFNAIHHLKRLMAKHNITMDDIEDERKERRSFIVKKEGKRLFLQIAVTVIGSHYKYGEYRNKIFIETTIAEYVEIESKYHFYWKIYQKELNLFFLAFVQSNHLFAPDAGTADYDKMTEDELKEAQRILKLADSIESKTYHKALQTSNLN